MPSSTPFWESSSKPAVNRPDRRRDRGGRTASARRHETTAHSGTVEVAPGDDTLARRGLDDGAFSPSFRDRALDEPMNVATQRAAGFSWIPAGPDSPPSLKLSTAIMSAMFTAWSCVRCTKVAPDGAVLHASAASGRVHVHPGARPEIGSRNRRRWPAPGQPAGAGLPERREATLIWGNIVAAGLLAGGARLMSSPEISTASENVEQCRRAARLRGPEAR